MRKISITKISALLVGLGMWLQTGLASATLLGDEVSYELSITFFDFSVANGSGVTAVGPGVEVDPIIGSSPFLALDVASSSFELLYDDAINRAIRTLEFDLTDLDWTDQPGEVLSANFAINDFADANASINTTADSVSLILDNQDGNFFVWQIGDRLVVDIVTRHAVPEPATLALIALGLAGLGFSKRKRAA